MASKECLKIDEKGGLIPIETIDTHKTREQLIQHPLLQAVNCKRFTHSPPPGTLIWAKSAGSVYWPAIITTIKEKDDSDTVDGLSTVENAFVLFLEKRFRVMFINWSRIIMADVSQIKEQANLITTLNRKLRKKRWSPNPFKEGLKLFWEFQELDINVRETRAFDLFNTEFGEKVQNKKSRRVSDGAILAKKEVDVKRRFTEGQVPAVDNAAKKVSKFGRKNNRRYSFRSTPSPISKLEVLSQGSSKKLKDGSLSKTDVNNNLNGTNSGASAHAAAVVMKNKKTGRPLLGGELLKEWTKDQFNKLDKKIVFESSPDLLCAACKEKIDKETLDFCHDYPFHKKCLIEVTAVSGEDGVVKEIFKCIDCHEKRCFICKERENTVKCSKCPLMFHRDCLESWPQAIIQGMHGPITCPLHFCHTCKAEGRCLNKMRNYKLEKSKAFRCIHCLTAYHKAGCLPAGCGATVSGNAFVECPKHLHKVSGLKKLRRLGCFACNKRLVEKDEHVECKICYMIFHPACIGYTDEDRKEGITLSNFSKNFQCNTCCWGLFPLYGQVVWFQQPGSSFWPARILYPKESAVRNKEKAGYYSIVYFGSQPSFFDLVSQSVPFHITGLDFLTKLNIYNEKPVLLTAYEEAGYTLNHSEANRDSLLPKPEPDYKKTERNYYRHNLGLGKRIDITKTTPVKSGDAIACNCGKLKEPKACVLNVGCYNRDTSVECHPNICSAPERCKNRMFSSANKTYDHLEIFATGKKGWGVKASINIAEGDFIIEYVGEVISRAEMLWRASRKTEEDPLYILDTGSNLFIDAEFLGNISRLINHSCEPNCVTEKYISLKRPVVGVFAARDIEAGEELTFNYAYGKNSAAPFKCYCKKEGCLGYIGRKVVEDEENLKPSIKRKLSLEEDSQPEADDESNNNCEVCTFGGRVILCDYDHCRKVFHLTCAGLKKAPRGLWICPTHPTEPAKKGRRISKKTVESIPSTHEDYPSSSDDVMDADTVLSPLISSPQPLGRTALSKRKPKLNKDKTTSNKTPVRSRHSLPSRSRTLKSLNTPV